MQLGYAYAHKGRVLRDRREKKGNVLRKKNHKRPYSGLSGKQSEFGHYLGEDNYMKALNFTFKYGEKMEEYGNYK